MFTTDLVNLYNRNIFKTSLYIYIFQDEKCRLMRNLSLSMTTMPPIYLLQCLLLIYNNASYLLTTMCFIYQLQFLLFTFDNASYLPLTMPPIYLKD